MHLRTLLSTLSLSAVALSQALTQPADLVAYLSPSDTSSTSENAIQGQTVTLPILNLTLLTNNTHALVSLNISKAVGSIGWVSVGFGTKMNDAAIVVLWPPADYSATGWTISHRVTSGYREPVQGRSLLGSPQAFAIVPDLISTVTITAERQRNRHYTTVSFIRQLELTADQNLFKNSAYVNVSRSATDQKVIWAYSQNRPSSMEESATLEMHDPGMFGWEEMDMTAVVSAGAQLDEQKGDQSWTKYDLVVLAHAGIGMILYLLVAPAAVLVKRLGHAWPRAYAVHSTLQGAIVVPGTFALAALGMLASYLGYSTNFTSHKFIGFLILLLVLFQLGAGYWSHKTRNPAATTRPWLSIAHIFVGIATLVLGWIQIRLGWGEWQGRTRPYTVSVIYLVFVFVFVGIYAASMALLIVRRRREGHSWNASALGLTPSSIPSSNAPAAASPRPWVDKVLDRWVVGDEDAKVLPPSELGAKGDLSAWK